MTETTTPAEKLHAIVNRPCYKEIQEGLAGLRRDFLDDQNIFVHLQALVDIMPRLQSVGTVAPPAPDYTPPTPLVEE